MEQFFNTNWNNKKEQLWNNKKDYLSENNFLLNEHFSFPVIITNHQVFDVIYSNDSHFKLIIHPKPFRYNQFIPLFSFSAIFKDGKKFGSATMSLNCIENYSRAFLIKLIEKKGFYLIADDSLGKYSFLQGEMNHQLGIPNIIEALKIKKIYYVLSEENCSDLELISNLIIFWDKNKEEIIRFLKKSTAKNKSSDSLSCPVYGCNFLKETCNHYR